MKKIVKLTVAILVFGSVVYACKVKQQQSNLSPQKSQLVTVQEVDDETLVKMLSRNWIVNVVNYVLQSWGNNLPPLTFEDAQKSLKDCEH